MTDPAHDELPFWLAEGEEECSSCLATQAYEVEVRCVACDRPLCSVCAVHVAQRRTIFCPSCFEET